MIRKNLAIMVLVILVCLTLFSTSESTIGFQIRQFFVSIGYLLFAALLWRNRYCRILSVILLLLWTTNAAISFIIYQLFDSQLNITLAVTILSTSFQESGDFLLCYWHIVLFSTVLFVCLLWVTHTLSQIISLKKLVIVSILFLTIIGYKSAEIVVKGKLSNPSFVFGEKVWPYTSLYNFAVFSRAINEVAILDAVANYQPSYQLTVNDTGINVYVIVLGESARRDHFSLYGYDRPTTPNMDAEKENLFIFNQAVAPAPITMMALSSALSIKAADETNTLLLSDNIIELANQADFKTYWFSKQGHIGGHDTPITTIANRAAQKMWFAEGYDDALLAKLDTALNDNEAKRKLIVLHTNGSHSIACHQYPEEEHFFTNGRSAIEDCYDNSIRFTDKLLGEVFARLDKYRASVLYFSDHGQIARMKHGEIDYTHGAINPSKQAVDVPQFIWFSPEVSSTSKHVGQYQPPYSTADNYYLIYDWLGIHKVGDENRHSIFSPAFVPRSHIFVIDTKLNKFDYQQLPADNIQ